jgi:hypothetical protein
MFKKKCNLTLASTLFENNRQLKARKRKGVKELNLSSNTTRKKRQSFSFKTSAEFCTLIQQEIFHMNLIESAGSSTKSFTKQQLKSLISLLTVQLSLSSPLS